MARCSFLPCRTDVAAVGTLPLKSAAPTTAPPKRCFFAVAWLAAFTALPGEVFAQPAAPPTTVEMTAPEVIKSGRTTFARNCSVGYCHGKEGRANRGPRLRGRSLKRDYLFRVIRDGIPRTSMPSWQQSLGPSEIWSVVAYIEMLSSLGPFDSDPFAPGSTEPIPSALPGGIPDVISVVTDTYPDTMASTGTGDMVGDPAAGERLFFDSSQEQYCGGCHQVAGIGGLVGPDLSDLRTRSARSIFIDTIVPDIHVSSEGQMYRLTTVDGEQLSVVLAGETRTRIRFYSVSTFPPVLRSFRGDQIGALQALRRSGMPATYGEQYTLKQLLDLVSFLKASGSSAPAQIPLTDIL